MSDLEMETKWELLKGLEKGCRKALSSELLLKEQWMDKMKDLVMASM
jgi:hypothetical protein